jgi:hypothetical protein
MEDFSAEDFAGMQETPTLRPGHVKIFSPRRNDYGKTTVQYSQTAGFPRLDKAPRINRRSKIRGLNGKAADAYSCDFRLKIPFQPSMRAEALAEARATRM